MKGVLREIHFYTEGGGHIYVGMLGGDEDIDGGEKERGCELSKHFCK